MTVAKEKTVRTTIVMPEDLYTRFANLAKRERRTVNSQLAVVVEKALQEREEEESILHHSMTGSK